MDFPEVVVPVNLAFGMGLFCLGIFVRVDVTVGMATSASQARISLLKRKAALKANKVLPKEDRKAQKRDLNNLMDTFNKQLLIYEERFVTLKKTIWFTLGGCLALVVSGFFLVITHYAFVLYWVVLPIFLVALICLFGAGLFGFLEVGTAHMADELLFGYLKGKENTDLTVDDDEKGAVPLSLTVTTLVDSALSSPKKNITVPPNSDREKPGKEGIRKSSKDKRKSSKEDLRKSSKEDLRKSSKEELRKSSKDKRKSSKEDLRKSSKMKQHAEEQREAELHEEEQPKDDTIVKIQG